MIAGDDGLNPCLNDSAASGPTRRARRRPDKTGWRCVSHFLLRRALLLVIAGKGGNPLDLQLFPETERPCCRAFLFTQASIARATRQCADWGRRTPPWRPTTDHHCRCQPTMNPRGSALGMSGLSRNGRRIRRDCRRQSRQARQFASGLVT
jgi:hypothetical protein